MSPSSITTLVPAGGLLPAGPAGDAPALLRAVAGAAPAVLARGPFDGVPFADTALRLVLLTALAVVAGTGLVRVLAGAPGRAERVVAGVAALVAVSAAVAAVTRSGAGPTGWTLFLLAATVAVPALLAGSRPVLAVVPALAVTALLVLQLAGTPGAAPWFALDAGYAVAGSLAAGAAVHLVTTRTDDDARPARVRVLGIAAGTVGAVLAAVRLAVAGPFSLTDVHGTGFGRAALVTVVAPAAVATLLLAESVLIRRAGNRVRADEVRDRVRTPAALAAVVAVGAATLLAALPAPAPAAVPGQALLRSVDLGTGPLTLAVAPMRPGPNLVQLTGAGVTVTGPDATMPTGHGETGAPAGYAVRAGDRDVPFTARSGAPGGWALVDLPEGTTSITLTAGGPARAVPVDVGTDRTAPAGASGADGPECLSAAVGRILAGGDPALGPCPSEGLDPADARALRGTVRALATQGAPGLAIAGDVSPRSRAAADVVRTAAGAAGLPVRSAPGPDDALVVVSGWQHAATTVRDTARAAQTTPTALGGTYLAPWLLTGGVLAQSPGTLLPLDFGPQEQVPQRYVRTLAAVAPGSAPSLSGLRAWAATTGEAYTDPAPALYGAAPVSVPMTADTDGGGHHGAPNEAAWFPGGAIVRIGSALSDPGPGAPAGPTP
ncbi:hypothetical protein WG925_18350 [Pseudonocardia carboxydivorans]|uniref:Uncharacterized protein n=2 Tax=Pseudonocardia alni TaxID=33907 RepID=A0ABU9AH27_PSEA5